MLLIELMHYYKQSSCVTYNNELHFLPDRYFFFTETSDRYIYD